MTDALVDVLADLHEVDPAAVGLTGFGRPDGYLDRQLRRWAGEWQALRTGDDLPGVDALAAELVAKAAARGRAGRSCTVTTGWTTSCWTRPTRRRVAAVLDWEMSTLGDPLADLGLLLVYWQPAAGHGVVTPSVTSLPGLPGRSALVARYAGPHRP